MYPPALYRTAADIKRGVIIGKLNQQKNQSHTVSSNQYGFMQAPDNPHYQAAEGVIGGYDGGAAALREGAARNANAISEAGNDFYGATTPDYVRDKVKESRLFKNNLDLGRGLADAKQNEIGFKNNAYMALGHATAPELVQLGSTEDSSGTGTRGLMDSISSLAGGFSGF